MEKRQRCDICTSGTKFCFIEQVNVIVDMLESESKTDPDGIYKRAVGANEELDKLRNKYRETDGKSTSCPGVNYDPNFIGRNLL